MRVSLRRPIDKDKHIREIDGLRLLAVAVVVVSHIVPSVARHYQDVTGIKTHEDVVLRLTTEGGRGVTLFFVISGFVLSLPFLRASATGSHLSVRRYLVRRLRRIEPPYVVSLAVFLFADIVLLRDSLRSLLPHFLAGLGYAHGLIFNARNPINSVTWSLEVEAQFYLVMPLIASLFFLAAGRRRALVLSLGGLSLMLAGPLGDSLRWTRSLAGCLSAFAIGIVIADVYLNEGWAGRAGSRTGDAVFVVGLGLFVMLPVISTGLANGYGQVLASGLMVVGALRGSFSRRVLRRPVAWIVGGMCYSIYLVHLQVIRLLWRPMQHVVYLGEWGFHKTLLVQVLVMASAVMLVSTAFFMLVELPCMRWSQRGSRSRPPLVVGGASTTRTVPARRCLPATGRPLPPACLLSHQIPGEIDFLDGSLPRQRRRVR